MGFEVALFLVLAFAAIALAFGMLLSENAVHSALFLIGNFAVVAVLFLMLDATFIAMVQIAVYAGAIMVLFLFVIMLLGAEKSEARQRFRSIPALATSLAAGLLISLGLPLLLSGLALPEPVGADPQVRLVHGANVASEDAVRDLRLSLALSGPTSVTYENVAFSDVTDFQALPPGDYQALLTRPDGSPVAPPTSLSLRPGMINTLVLYGALDLNAGTFVQLGTVQHSLAPVEDNAARMQALVELEGGPYSLIDLGPNRTIDLRKRPQLDENGAEVLDENGQPVLVDAIDDPVLADGLVQGQISEPFEFKAGGYWLALVDAENRVVKVMEDYDIKKDTEKTLLFVPDYEAEPNVDGSYRIRLLDRSGATLTLPIAATYGSPRAVGQVLFTDYLLPVNLVGLLLLIALVGVVILNRPDGEKQERRANIRRKVSRPLINVISQQTGRDVLEEQPRLNPPSQAPSGD